MSNDDELLLKVYHKILGEWTESQLTREALLQRESYRAFVLDTHSRIAKELNLQETIDDMCRSYSLELPLPPGQAGNMELGAYLYDRFDFAKRFADGLRSFVVAAPDMTEQDLTCWLLIECWHEFGAVLWRTGLLNPPDDSR
jgi:hypothetical protein